MMQDLSIGAQALKGVVGVDDLRGLNISVVRDLADYQKVIAIRSVAFMADQNCPFNEEFDGNDLCAMHLLVEQNGQPVATLRLRWFAGFGKVERVCILPAHRGSPLLKAMLAYAFELAARKGYRLMTAQIQARLWPLWSRMLNCRLKAHRSRFSFSDYDYVEIDIPLPEHPRSIREDADPFVMIRPEGDWDTPGVLDCSAERSIKQEEAA